MVRIELRPLSPGGSGAALVIEKLFEDLQTLEQRKHGPQLYLPSGLRYTGDLTKVG
jgi:hypothetical protein